MRSAGSRPASRPKGGRFPGCGARDIGRSGTPAEGARSPRSSTCVLRKPSFTGSSRRRSVLRYFLLSSAKTVTTTASPPSASCAIRAARKLAPEEIPTPMPERPGELLGHEDGVAVVHGEDGVELVEFDDRRDELVGDALDPVVADLVSGGHGGGIGGLDGMQRDAGHVLAEELPRPHDRAAGAHAGHERRRHEPLRRQLTEDFRAGRLVVGLAVVRGWRTAAAGTRPAWRVPAPRRARCSRGTRPPRGSPGRCWRRGCG